MQKWKVEVKLGRIQLLSFINTRKNTWLVDWKYYVGQMSFEQNFAEFSVK